MDFFAAPVGTYIIHKDDADWRMVVVGFVHVQGNRVDPVTLSAFKGISEPHGILHPDGSVTYRNGETVYPNEDDWRDALATEALVKEPEPGPDTKPINWGTKSAKTKSYWVWHGAQAVFELPGEKPYPDDPRIEKIKRDEFFELKRTGFTEMDPLTGVITGDKTEAPAEETDEDEDDVSGLI